MDVAVQLTNDFSIVSKFSMVSQRYFTDDFIKFFANKLVRRTPIINLGYYVRAQIIDDILNYFMSSASRIQVLSMGAGYDTTYFRLNKKSLLKYIEIDLNDVVDKKIEIIRRTPSLLQQVPNWKVHDYGITSENYALIAQNLNDLNQLERKLQMLDFKLDSFVIVLTECSITYMDEMKSTQLIEWVARNCPKSVFINYEQVHPEDAFGRIMTSHFVSVGNPIKSLERYRTVENQRTRYLEAGFDKCISVTAMELVEHAFASQFAHRLRLEPFDEWEELHAKCCHYALTVAINGSVDFPLYLSRLASANRTLSTPCDVMTCELDTRRAIQRFGHATVAVCGDWIILGGFGLNRSSGRHGRLKNVEFIESDSCKITVTGEPLSIDCLYMKCAAIDERTFAIYGGRCSPNREVNAELRIAHCQSGDDSMSIRFDSVIGCTLLPRWRHSLSFCNGCLVIFGGRNSQMDVFGDLWMYDLAAQKWYSWTSDEVSDSNGPRPRFSHSDAVCSSRNEVIVSGGLSKSFKPVNDIFLLKIRKPMKDGPSVEWARITVVPEIKPRYGHTSHVSGRCLLLVGGCNANCAELPELCVVNLDNLCSVEYNIQICVEKPILLHSHTSELVKPHEVVIYGGGGNCFSFGTHYNAHPLRVRLPTS